MADIDEIDLHLGEFHGKIFDLSQAAREAGDEAAAAVAAYIHDQFCLVRMHLKGTEAEDFIGAPYPRFRKRSAA